MTTSSLSCAVVGKPEFYGIWIRLSFYLLWFGITLARWIHDPTLFLLLLGTHFLFACAVFLGLLVALTNSPTLSAAEVYLIVVLISGLACYSRLPYYIWRVVTAFRQGLDCGFYYHLGLRDRFYMPGPYAFGVAETVLMICLIGTHLWFWSTGVDSEALYANGKDPDGSGCDLEEQVGFVFQPADLRSPGFRDFIAIIIFAISGGTLITALADAGCIASEGESRSWKRRRRRRERMRMRYSCPYPLPLIPILTSNILTTYTSDGRLGLLRKLQTTSDLAVTPIIISAIESTIMWNGIPGADTANTAAQLIPLLLGIVLLTMIVIQLALIAAGVSQESRNCHEEDNGREHDPSPPVAMAMASISQILTSKQIRKKPSTIYRDLCSRLRPQQHPQHRPQLLAHPLPASSQRPQPQTPIAQTVHNMPKVYSTWVANCCSTTTSAPIRNSDSLVGLLPESFHNTLLDFNTQGKEEDDKTTIKQIQITRSNSKLVCSQSFSKKAFHDARYHFAKKRKKKKKEKRK